MPGPVNIIVPTLPANPGPLQAFGDFRLIPYGYVGPIPHTYEPPNIRSQLRNEPTVTSDPASVRRAPLFREPQNIPPGYSLASAESKDIGGTNFSVVLRYDGPYFELVVGRGVIWRKPIDVYLYAPPRPNDPASEVITGSVGGLKAVFQKPIPGREYQGPLVIQFTDGRTHTSLEWRVTDPANAEAEFAQLLRVAESLVVSPATPTTMPSPTATPRRP